MEQAVTAIADASLDALGASAWDVIVIGAGPAGAIAAHQAARQGLRTLLVDAKRFPRRKVCGGCLSQSAVVTLKQAGLESLLLELGAPRIDRVCLFSGDSHSELPLPGGYAIDRAEFDLALAQRAIAAGVSFVTGCVAKVLGVESGVQRIGLTTPSRTTVASARVVVVADGLLRSSLHAEASAVASPAPRSRIGVATLVAARDAQPAFGAIEMSIACHGYAGQVRLDDQRTLIAAAIDRDLLSRRSIGEAVAMIVGKRGEPIRESLFAAEWQAAPPLTRKPPCIAGERWFAIGDAAGYVEPFTGDGMAAALETGVAVAPWLAAAQRTWTSELAAAWSIEHRRIVGRRQWLCRGLAWTLRRPWAADMLLSLCRHAPHFVSRTLATVQQRTAACTTLGQAAIP
jgi:flavin-dependent dehydrogenase